MPDRSRFDPDASASGDAPAEGEALHYPVSTRDADTPPRTQRETPSLGGPIAAASRRCALLCLLASGFGLVVLTGLILYQVVTRYVFSAPPAWSEQAALYVLVWTILIAGAAGVREEFHIRITAGQDALPEAARRRALYAAHAVTGSIGVFAAVYGTQLVLALWPYAIPTLGLPRGSAFLPLPLAGVLIAAFSAEHIAALRAGRKVAPTWR